MPCHTPDSRPRWPRRLTLAASGLFLAIGASATAVRAAAWRGAVESPRALVAPADSVPLVLDWAELSPDANALVRQVHAAVHDLDTPERARAAGFRPALGWIPTMGTHWVHRERMRDGFDLDAPDHLMFSSVGGEQRLVGVAYAYRDAADAERPDAFPGDLDVWHDHPELAPGGETLVMLHVWFVPSPDGPFAGHNPWLGYYAAGLPAPDARWLTDAAAWSAARRAALALGEATEPSRVAEIGRRSGMLADSVTRHYDAARALAPALADASARDDGGAWLAAAGRAAGIWDALRAEYLAAARPMPRLQERAARFFDEMEHGRHGEHAAHRGH